MEIELRAREESVALREKNVEVRERAVALRERRINGRDDDDDDSDDVPEPVLLAREFSKKLSVG
jgi:hypothetical protein